LMDDFAEQRVAQRQDKGEPAITTFDMADRQRAWSQPPRQAQSNLADSHKIMVAMEIQRLAVRTYRESNTKTTAQIFLQAGRSGEAFAAVDDLRKPTKPPVHPSPKLTASRPIFGDGDDGGDGDVIVQRQGRADQAAKLGDQLAQKGPAAFDNL